MPRHFTGFSNSSVPLLLSFFLSVFLGYISLVWNMGVHIGSVYCIVKSTKLSSVTPPLCNLRSFYRKTLFANIL